MPQQGDTIKTVIVQELDGVQLSNTLYWRVDDLGADPTTAVGLNDVLVEYVSIIQSQVASAWSVVCGIYENMTRNEAKQIVFVSLPGIGVTDCHPQDQVVRVNRYCQKSAPLPAGVGRGAFNQSGVLESLSTKGRVNNMTAFQGLQNFLRVQQVFGANWTLGPQLRLTQSVGPPKVYQFNDVTQAQPAGRLFKLGSRKTVLCALS